MSETERTAPKAIDILLSELNDRKAHWNSMASPVSLRVPDILLAELDAIAHQTGQNRSQTINRLLEIALEHVRNGMTEEVWNQHMELAEKYMKPNKKQAES